MSRPSTNWCPSSRIACATAVRMTGSPRRLIASCSVPVRPSSAPTSTLPVSSSAHVEALTSGELECPRCAAQSDAPILSSISVSIVSVSGTRSSASARHMRATPSRVESPYSARKPCMIEVPARARVVRTRSTARAGIDSRSARASPAASTLSRIARDSSSSVAARILARISESRGRGWAMPGPRVDDSLGLASLTRVPLSSGAGLRLAGDSARPAKCGPNSCLNSLTFGPAVPAPAYAIRYPIATLAKLGRAPSESVSR